MTMRSYVRLISFITGAYLYVSLENTRQELKLIGRDLSDDKSRLNFVSEEKSSWIINPGEDKYLSLYSAYWDDRSVDISPVIRIIGFLTDRNPYINLRNETSFRPMCFFKCFNDDAVYTIPEKNADAHQIFRPRVLDDMRFFKYVFSCHLSDSPCERPQYVTVVDSTTTYETGLPQSLTVSNSLEVKYVSKNVSQVDFGACGPMLYNATDPHRLVEWLEMMKLLGVRKVDLYLYHGITGDTMEILKYFRNRGLVEFTRFQDAEFHLLHKYQLYHHEFVYTLATLSLTDCMYKNMYKFKWMAVLDLDEIILPRKDNNYQELFQRLSMPRSGRNPVGYKFAHTDYIVDPIFSNQSIDQTMPKFLTMMRHRYRFPTQPGHYHPKSIINPRLCTAMHYHVCRGYLHGVDKARLVDSRLAQDCHFRAHICPIKTNSSQECLTALQFGRPKRDDRILIHKHSLQRSVIVSLRELGLLPNA